MAELAAREAALRLRLGYPRGQGVSRTLVRILARQEMPDDLLLIRVECYAGHRGEETPRRFWIEDRAVAVAEILDRWLAPDHRYFKVLGDDRHVYIIRFDAGADRWELTMFQRR